MTKTFKRREKIQLGRRKMYRFYRKNLRKRNLEHNIVNETLYTKILNDFNKELRRKILEEAFEFIMPLVGQLGIRKYKPYRVIDKNGNLDIRYKPAINWELSRKLHKRVYHTNTHSDGYKYYIRYSSYRCVLPNKHFYKFIPCRTFKRLLSETIKNPEFRGDFYEISR